MVYRQDSAKCLANTLMRPSCASAPSTGEPILRLVLARQNDLECEAIAVIAMKNPQHHGKWATLSRALLDHSNR
jgi:hypothetical protein